MKINRLFIIPLLLLSTVLTAGAAQVTLSADSSSGPVVNAAIGVPVTFSAEAVCTSPLAVVPGTVGIKNNGSSSEVEWQMTNNTAATIRLTGFGISWNCLADPGNDCDTWRFDYVKFDTPVTGAQKIYKPACYDAGNSFPVIDFDQNVGNGAYANKYLDIPAGGTVGIKEFEFVDSGCGGKINPVTAGTQVEFTVTWRDDTGTLYPQIFTVTW